ncbi:hypothetical protein I79_009047 [Cricetulus griseus]|uniref:Uncharacterized protein n=1 Tax=Cricetulus griseus TaxID=10029 RepID=G3HEQ4_CRIGR|nr:hypothetical protein I79_009047 [Cricetulus griseus]
MPNSYHILPTARPVEARVGYPQGEMLSSKGVPHLKSTNRYGPIAQEKGSNLRDQSLGLGQVPRNYHRRTL